MSDLVGNPADRFSHNKAHIPVSAVDSQPERSTLYMYQLLQRETVYFYDANFPINIFGILSVFRVRNREYVLLEAVNEKTGILHMQFKQRCRTVCAVDQRFCFHYLDSTIPLLPKSEILSIQPSSVAEQPICVGPGLKP